MYVAKEASHESSIQSNNTQHIPHAWRKKHEVHDKANQREVARDLTARANTMVPSDAIMLATWEGKLRDWTHSRATGITNYAESLRQVDVRMQTLKHVTNRKRIRSRQESTVLTKRKLTAEEVTENACTNEKHDERIHTLHKPES